MVYALISDMPEIITLFPVTASGDNTGVGVSFESAVNFVLKKIKLEKGLNENDDISKLADLELGLIIINKRYN